MGRGGEVQLLAACMHVYCRGRGGSATLERPKCLGVWQGKPVESMCCRAGAGSSVLDPFPSVILASLRAVDHRCCTPLQHLQAMGHLSKKQPPRDGG